MEIQYKDPDSNLDFHFEWQTWADEGDYLTASVWVVPAGLTGGAESLFVGQERDLAGEYRDVQRTSIFLSGGTAGQSYTVTNRITTVRGRQEDRSFELRIQEH